MIRFGIVLPWDLVDPEDYRKPREWSGKHWEDLCGGLDRSVLRLTY